MNVDIALKEYELAGRPVRMGMIGAGATVRAISLNRGAQPVRNGNLPAGIAAWGRCRLFVRRSPEFPADAPC